MVLGQTASCFKGITLDYSYMCPQCILQIKGTLKTLPISITERTVKLESIYQSKLRCFQSHELTPVWVTQGYGGSTSTPDSMKFQGNKYSFNLTRRCTSCFEKLQFHGPNTKEFSIRCLESNAWRKLDGTASLFFRRVT